MTRNREDEIVKASIAYANEEFPEHEFVWNCFANDAKWADKTMIDKACRWLSDNNDNYIIDIEGETLIDDQIIKDFRKTMEE